MDQNSPAKSNSGVQSIERAFGIIEELSSFSRGLHLSDLSSRLNLHPSTVHRLLNTLSSLGYVQKDSSSGKYRLTLRLFEIGSRLVGSANIVTLAKPSLDRLADLTGETIHLVVPEETEVVYLYKSNPSANITMGSTVGLHNPMYCTGVGKAILAHWDEADIEKMWKRTEIIQYTSHTITNYSDLIKELSAIRQKHYAIDNEEHEYGVKCIAAPIIDIHNNAIAAVSISAPAVRITEDKIAPYSELIISAASEISMLMGNSGR